MSLAAAAAKGALSTVSSQAIGVVVRMAALVVLSRLLPAHLFGLVALAAALNMMLTTIIQLGLPMATVQAGSLSQPAKSALFWINALLGLVIAATVWFCAEPIADLYGRPQLATVVQVLCLVPLLTGLQGQFRVQLMRDLRFGRLAASEVTAQVVSVVIAIALAALGYELAAVIAQPVSLALTQLILVVIASRWWPSRPGYWRSEVRTLIGIGARVFGMNALRQTARGAIVPVMGLQVTATDLGNYDRAQNLSLTPISLTVDQLTRVAVPTLSRLRDQPLKMREYLVRAQLVTVCVTGTFFLVLAALAQPFISVLLGSGWPLAGDVLQLLCLGAVFRALGQTSTWLFVASEATKQGLRFNAWAQPAIVVLSLAGLPWGVKGVAAASSLAWTIYWPVSTLIAARAAGFGPAPLLTGALWSMLRFSAPVGAAALATRLLPADDPAILLAGAFAASATAALLYLIPPVRDDLRTIIRTLRLATRRTPDAAEAREPHPI